MSGINETLLKIAQAKLSGTEKLAFVPMPAGVGGGAPVDPMAAMGGGAPMDPGMMPAATGMDPASAMAAGGMPVDPAMAMAGGAGGAAPVDTMTGMPMEDPAAAAGDAAAAGGQPPIDPALQAAIDEAVAKATGGKGGGAEGGAAKPKSSGKVDPEAFSALQADVSEMKGMLQKAIGFLMGTGQIASEEAVPQGLGEAEGPATPVAPPAEEKAAFVYPPRDELVAALTSLMS